MGTVNALGQSGTEGAEQTISLTQKAVEKITGALERDGLTGYGVRIGVAGSSCSGFQYRLSFEERPQPGDTVWRLAGLRIFVDDRSKGQLEGITLDYVVGLHAAGFKFIDPNPTHSCGCGNS